MNRLDQKNEREKGKRKATSLITQIIRTEIAQWSLPKATRRTDEDAFGFSLYFGSSLTGGGARDVPEVDFLWELWAVNLVSVAPPRLPEHITSQEGSDEGKASGGRDCTSANGARFITFLPSPSKHGR